MNRPRLHLIVAFFALLFLVSCIVPISVNPRSTEAPALSPELGPNLPFTNPNILGVSLARPQAVESIEEALACLASDKVVYGLALQNTNIRAETGVRACRVGRAPSGSLLRIQGVYELGESAPIATLGAAEGTTVDYSFGYAEDIAPIFNKNCSTCHGAVAQTAGLQVTDYAALLRGSERGEVLIPGDAEASKLWQQIESNKMPVIGELSDADKTLIKAWIDGGAQERRRSLPRASRLWLDINAADFDAVPNTCADDVEAPQTLASRELVAFLSCGTAPSEKLLAEFSADAIARANAPTKNAAPIDLVTGLPSIRVPTLRRVQAASSAAPARVASASFGGIQAGALGLAPPNDGDPYLTPQGGFCIEHRLQRKLQDQRSITALAFAPDGRLFLALDSLPTGRDVDNIVLTDAFHPSRSIAVVNSNDDGGFTEIFTESGRITGLDYHNGALYVSRSGEIGRIPDGGKYERLAAGFAVRGDLFHANNGIVVSDGWVYVSTGGVRDGWSDGPIENIGEDPAISVVAGGNRFAARLVRAPLDQLLSQRSIEVFQTAARGFRNPYGVARDPGGHIWVTDNGATNVPEGISAGDEVNVFNPATVPAGTAESQTPFYGFPLALNGYNPDWYTQPVVDLPNTGAPTGITWAYGTIFYGQYGRNPGLYRLGVGGGADYCRAYDVGLAALGCRDHARWVTLDWDGSGRAFQIDARVRVAGLNTR